MSKTTGDVKVENVSISYGTNCVLKEVSLNIPANSIYAFIGPSGCGKTTLLRSINRMNDFISDFKLTGKITIDGNDIYKDKNPEKLRRNVGMVFQQPNPLPVSIMKNMLLPVTEHYRAPVAELKSQAVEKLKSCALYDEVSGKLEKSAYALSGGQQQRLCIARALMLDPAVILFDEPCSALDPISTFKIEDLLGRLKKERTIIIVTHNMEQARRIADYTAFFYDGIIVEKGETVEMFSHPQTELLNNYISGRF